jgi:hypothetical protein
MPSTASQSSSPSPNLPAAAAHARTRWLWLLAGAVAAAAAHGLDARAVTACGLASVSRAGLLLAQQARRIDDLV